MANPAPLRNDDLRRGNGPRFFHRKIGRSEGLNKRELGRRAVQALASLWSTSKRLLGGQRERRNELAPKLLAFRSSCKTIWGLSGVDIDDRAAILIDDAVPGGGD